MKALKVGDILVYTWGWEQTNVDFYEVVGVTAKSAVIREVKAIRTDGPPMSMTGTSVPSPGDYDGEPQRKSVKHTEQGEPWVKMAHGHADLWDGTPQNWSSYG